MMKKKVPLILLLALFVASPNNLKAQSVSLDQFEKYVKKAREAGATHVSITADIPPALWQLKENPRDPYPAWFIYQPGILKIFPPKMLQPYMDMDYAKKVQQLFAKRSAIIRKYGLKAYYSTNEPQVLPKAFFQDHPLLRGPRVDQPNRSRAAHYAPCTDRPEVRQMYREAIQQLLKTAPQVEIFSFMTSDSGAGFCWSPALYPGKNGPSWCKNRPMKDRVADFLEALKDGAQEVGKNIEVNIHGIKPRQWMTATFDNPKEIAKILPEGLAVEGFEGPDGDHIAWNLLGSRNAFYPVVGIPQPVSNLRSMMNFKANAPLIVSIDDTSHFSFNLKLYDIFKQEHPQNSLQMMTTLHDFAEKLAGENNANDLVNLWTALDQAQQYLNTLNFGPVLTMGPILGRWINRPVVPYPNELTQKEKSYYRPYLFQAKGEKQANNLIDIQAMRMYEGYGARLLVQRVIELVTPQLTKAEDNANSLAQDNAGEKANQWSLLAQRIRAAQSLTRTVDNMVGYQALLTLAKNDSTQVEPNPVLGTKGSWKRQELLRIARNEADNAAELRKLLLNTKGPIIHTAPTPEQETIRMLSPNLPDQLKQKVDIIMAHWMDYNRLFTRPNQ